MLKTYTFIDISQRRRPSQITSGSSTGDARSSLLSCRLILWRLNLTASRSSAKGRISPTVVSSSALTIASRNARVLSNSSAAVAPGIPWPLIQNGAFSVEFSYKYDELAELAAVIDRLYEFHQLTEQRPTNKPKNCQHAVQVANASIRTPDNKIILENLNFHVSPGKWLLLKGYSGAGKTTLLKTLSHCWPWFKGDISSPADSWYVSQTPLIKSGLLKEIICKALPLPVDDKSLSEVLHQVGLGKLAARIHEHDRWGDILSSGEKQRIALARLILRRPKWIFLDETTSHLEEQEAIRLLRLVREKLPTSGVIMVTHQPGVWNLADDICDISTVL